MGIKNLFRQEEVSRLSDTELRKFYLASKISQKHDYILSMVLSIIITIVSTSLAISFKVYWILLVAILFLAGFILNMIRYGRLIEDIFENKIVEEEYD